MNALDRLSPHLEDERVTDILFDSSIKGWVEIDGKLIETQNPFENEQDLQAWVKNILSSGGARLDIAKPLSEVTLRTDFGLIRLHCVLAGECSQRTHLSIRRHKAKQLSLTELLQDSQVGMEQQLRQIINDKQNFVIIGGTGAGKTTLLKALLNEVKGERIITIEDSPELDLCGRCVALLARPSNQEGVGEISQAMLLREALRMRPDRLVIGEARGSELLVLLQALNTGHSGSGFTLHANSSKAAVPRMLAILSGAGVNTELARILLASSIQWVVEVQKIEKKRVVLSIEKLALNDL